MSEKKHKLKLVRWAQDNYPPIDLNNESEHVRELIQEYGIAERIIEKGNEMREAQVKFYQAKRKGDSDTAKEWLPKAIQAEKEFDALRKGQGTQQSMF